MYELDRPVSCSIGRAMEILGEPRPRDGSPFRRQEPPRHEYRLTEAGRDLYPAIVTLMRWGDRHLSTDPPVVLRHNSCGHEADPLLVCSHCHEELDPHEVTPVRNVDVATA